MILASHFVSEKKVIKNIRQVKGTPEWPVVWLTYAHALGSIQVSREQEIRFFGPPRNFENVLFANVNYDIFNMELRKRKQPDSDNDN